MRAARGDLGGSPLPALRVPGTAADCPFLGRDQGFSTRDNEMISNAIEQVADLRSAGSD